MITETGACESGVRFVPSRVDGVTGVCEVAVFSDRLEVKGERGWVTFRYADFAQNAEQRTCFNRRPKRGRVARIGLSPERYADSYVRFLTEPPITVYMPENGPTRFPDSVFWRVQQTIRSGGYELPDADDPPPEPDPLDALPRRARLFVQTVTGVAVVNFISFMVISLCIGGDALNGKVENGRYFLSQNGRLTEVSPGLWTFSRYHAISMIALWVSMFAVLGAATLYAKARAEAAPPHR